MDAMPRQMELPGHADHQARSATMRASSRAAWEGDMERKAPARWAAYQVLARHGSLTASEVGKMDPATGKCPWKRVGELVEIGLAEERAERKCRVSGETVLTYAAIDGAVPGTRKPAASGSPPKPSKSEINVAISDIEATYVMSRGCRALAHPSVDKLVAWLRYQVGQA